MRILFSADPEVPVPPDHYGGVQRLVAALIDELQSRGHTIALLAHPDSQQKVDTFFPLSGTRSQHPIDTIRNTYAYYRAVKSFQPDIIHSFSRLFYLLPVLKSVVPKIMTYGRYPSARQVQRARLLAGSTLSFTGCSEHITQKGMTGGGIWQRVYNFVELEKLTFQSDIASDAPLVFLSRIERIKGLHTAIEIAQKSDTPLIIAGNRPELADAKEYWLKDIKPHIDGRLIQYVGSVDDQQKNELLGKAKALLVPIEWEEPFGLVFAEALACGTPVISTGRGAVPEIIRDGQEGFIIRDSKEGIQAVSQLHRIERKVCRQRVEEMFTLPIITDEYVAHYERALEYAKGMTTA